MAVDGTARWLDLTRRRLQLAVAVMVVLLVAGVSVLLTGLRADGSDPQVDTALHGEVKRVAGEFAANVNTYSAGDVDSYRRNVEPMLTPRFAQSFGKAIDDIVQQMQQAKVSSEGEVLTTAVSSLDKDSAVALVVADAQVSSDLGDRQRHFRWRLDLVRGAAGERWLVDDFKPV